MTAALDDGAVVAAAMIFLLRGQPVALLDYLMTRPDRRGGGLGQRLLEASIATLPGRPVLIEVDSEREQAADNDLRVRRKAFYRRAGCRQVLGLDYLFALPGDGPPPVMDLLVHLNGAPEPSRAALGDWLRDLLVEAYAVSDPMPLLDRMMASVPEPLQFG